MARGGADGVVTGRKADGEGESLLMQIAESTLDRAAGQDTLAPPTTSGCGQTGSQKSPRHRRQGDSIIGWV